MNKYKSIETCEYVEEIKKSRFIVHTGPAADEAGAMKFIAEHSLSDARHNCWAFRAGSVYRFSDDGEPGGTAGRPILSAIDNKNLDYTAVVTARYFGGIKLGTGGLVRAYSGTASKCIDLMETERIRNLVTLMIETDFQNTGKIYGILKKKEVRVTDESYSEGGILLTLEVEDVLAESLRDELTEAVSGSLIFR